MIANLRYNVQNRAEEILRQHGFVSAPIDVLKLAKILGLAVYSVRFSNPDISGGIKFLDKGAEIYVNVNDSWNRKRFTIAHEIGHYVLHKDDFEEGFYETIDMFRNTSNHEKREIEANEFAASILMPRDLVRKEWGIWGSTEILADIFKVSLAAMSYRLFILGLKGDW